MPLKVAIIGSGPAGYYTAEAVIKSRPDAQVDIIDRLPTPYGLIRAGVAPDHQSIKAVTRRFEATHNDGDVAFFGNINIGDAVSVADLRKLYDAVVLATGAPGDRALGIEGETLKGVIGAAAFVGWYNGHPDFADLAPSLNFEHAVVIGNGNVAIDVARVLMKTPDEMATSDLARPAAELIHKSPLRQVTIIGRRGPLDASFTTKELGELGELHDTKAVTDASDMPPAGAEDNADPGLRKVIVHLRKFAEIAAHDKPKRINFRFYSKPVAVTGDGRVEHIQLERTRVENGKAIGTGEITDLPCGLIVSCIGYRTSPIAGVPFDNDQGRFMNVDGLIEVPSGALGGIYCVGWARRGPTGTIGTNRPDGYAIADLIMAHPSSGVHEGRAGLGKVITDNDLYAVSFAGWKNIEAAEIANARAGSPREKFVRVENMLQASQ